MRRILIAFLSAGLLWSGSELALSQSRSAVPPVDPVMRSSPTAKGVVGVGGTVNKVITTGQGVVDTYQGAGNVVRSNTPAETTAGAMQTTAGVLELVDAPFASCAKYAQGKAMNASCAKSGDALIEENAAPCAAAIAAAMACAIPAMSCTPAAAAAAGLVCGKAAESAAAVGQGVKNTLDMAARPVDPCDTQPCIKADPTADPCYNQPCIQAAPDDSLPVSSANLAKLPPMPSDYSASGLGLNTLANVGSGTSGAGEAALQQTRQQKAQEAASGGGSDMHQPDSFCSIVHHVNVCPP